VHLEWPKFADEKLGWPALAQLMKQQPAALCVVNTRKKAGELFTELKKVAPTGSYVFHLSTTMCPDHRRQVLTAVKAILSVGQTCYLVSTQLIEAGVDIDFPVVSLYQPSAGSPSSVLRNTITRPPGETSSPFSFPSRLHRPAA
jgi:Lhr-like helicase